MCLFYNASAENFSTVGKFSYLSAFQQGRGDAQHPVNRRSGTAISVVMSIYRLVIIKKMKHP